MATSGQGYGATGGWRPQRRICGRFTSYPNLCTPSTPPTDPAAGGSAGVCAGARRRRGILRERSGTVPRARSRGGIPSTRSPRPGFPAPAAAPRSPGEGAAGRADQTDQAGTADLPQDLIQDAAQNRTARTDPMAGRPSARRQKAAGASALDVPVPARCQPLAPITPVPRSRRHTNGRSVAPIGSPGCRRPAAP
jgi:hypothetical protein